MLNPVCDDTKCKRFCIRPSFTRGRAVGEHARQGRNLTDPATIVFTVDFYPHHCGISAQSLRLAFKHVWCFRLVNRWSACCEPATGDFPDRTDVSFGESPPYI